MTLNYDNENVNSVSGNFVLRNQQTAGEEGFSKVSKIWFDRTMSYDDGLKHLFGKKKERVDLTLHPDDFSVELDNNSFVLKTEERQFYLTNHALRGLMRLGSNKRASGVPGTSILRVCTDAHEYFEEKQVSLTHLSDGYDLLCEQLVKTAYSELRDKNYFIRTSGDYVRAFLSEDYSPIPNEWFVETVAELIPGGRLSHFDRSSADTIRGNVLIPDILLSEEDSDYAGMLSLSNCEIGTRRLGLTPSIFRAICMNGCIWNQKKGESFSVVHKGQHDLESLKAQMDKCIRTSIQLLPSYITQLLATKQWKVKKEDVTQIFAEIVKENQLTATDGQNIIGEWAREEGGEYTAFHILNGLTRHSQNLHPEKWGKVDEFAGGIIMGGPNKWERLVSGSKRRSLEKAKDILNISA